MTYFCSGHQGGSHDCAGDQSAIHEGRCQPAAGRAAVEGTDARTARPEAWFIHGLARPTRCSTLNRARPGRRSASRLRFDGNSGRVHLENVQLRLGPGYCERSLCPQGRLLRAATSSRGNSMRLAWMGRSARPAKDHPRSRGCRPPPATPSYLRLEAQRSPAGLACSQDRGRKGAIW